MCKEETKRIINSAFSGAQPPGSSRVVFYYDPETQEICNDFDEREWDEVPMEILQRHIEALYFFSKEGYRYYLPAYLLFCLDYPAESDIAPEVVTSTLLRPPIEDFEYTELGCRLNIFTGAERNAILAWLEYMNDFGPKPYKGYEYERAISVIRQSKDAT